MLYQCVVPWIVTFGDPKILFRENNNPQRQKAHFVETFSSWYDVANRHFTKGIKVYHNIIKHCKAP